MKRTLTSETPKFVNGKVKVAGWVNVVRSHGKILFVDLRDRSGILQVVFSPPASAQGSGEAKDSAAVYELAKKVRFIRNHGEKEKYKSLMLGHNYRMPEIQAAIGCVQLKKLPKFLAKRSENAKRLTEKLKKAKRLQLPKETEGYKHSWYLYTVRMKGAKKEERDKVVKKLRRKEIGAEVYYMYPVHLMSYCRKFGKYRLPETEKIAEQVFSLPIHPGVTAEQINFIGETVLHLLG